MKQEGYFAFLDAVQAYSPASGYRFTTYLHYPLQNRINALLGVRTVRTIKAVSYTHLDVYKRQCPHPQKRGVGISQYLLVKLAVAVVGLSLQPVYQLLVVFPVPSGRQWHIAHHFSSNTIGTSSCKLAMR